MLPRLTLALAFLLASPLFAGPVRLSDDAGTIVVEGELLSRDGEFFRVDTEYGAVTIDAGMMSCSGAGCPDPSEMVVRSAVGGPEDLVHRLFPALLEAFADARGLSLNRIFRDDAHVSWELTQQGTDRLLAVFDVAVMAEADLARALRDGSAQLGFSSILGSPEVRQDVIALDALVPAVAPENPRVMVTLEQLKALLQGDMPSWAPLGGSDVPVSVHVSQGLDGALQALDLGRLRSDAVRYDAEDLMADTVARDASALGIMPYSALGNAVPLVVSGACGLATPATRDTIRAEDYPMTRPLFLQRVGVRHPKLVREFMAFARSPAAQPLIRAAGFIDQAIGRISFEQQGNRIANAVLAAGQDAESIADVQDMIGTLLNGARLTLTFRFTDGSTDLDPQSVSNIQRLADAISDGMFDGETVLFVGFSDGVGEKAANLRLSERRANSVRHAVAARIAERAVALEVAAFGELMPMACDDTPWGGRVNRRVEVWVKPSEVSR